MHSICISVLGYPTTVFIDSKGNVVGDVYLTGTTEAEYKKELGKRLKIVENGEN